MSEEQAAGIQMLSNVEKHNAKVSDPTLSILDLSMSPNAPRHLLKMSPGLPRCVLFC